MESNNQEEETIISGEIESQDPNHFMPFAINNVNPVSADIRYLIRSH